MSPDSALVASPGALRIEFEPAMDLPAFRRGLNEHQHAVVFRQAIEHAVSVGDGALAQSVLLGPDFFPGLEILADPADAIGITVEIALHEDYPAVMVFHHLVEVDVVGFIFGP